MKATAWPREDRGAERLLWVNPRHGEFGDAVVRDLPALPRPGDLVVVNDAATLPASLHGTTPSGEPVEVRLASRDGDSDAWTCLVFGEGDWRTTTELRPRPPALAPGVVVRFHGELTARVRSRGDGPRERVVVLEFDQTGDRFWGALYRAGKPVQYAYTREPLSLFHVETAYASRPWASEMPSAGRPLSWRMVLALRRRGVGVARITHAAGLSSTGDPALDATLPWPERFHVPNDTVLAIAATRARAGRVIAVGTSVVRALEGAARAGGSDEPLTAGEGTTDLVIDAGFVPRVVSGLFTGLHEATASHFSLLQAFASRDLIERAYAHALRAGYEGHEFGDSCLILPR